MWDKTALPKSTVMLQRCHGMQMLSSRCKKTGDILMKTLVPMIYIKPDNLQSNMTTVH